jgi:hypothetical protein
MFRPKNLEIRNIVMTVKSQKKLKTDGHGMEPDSWKVRALHEGDNPSLGNELLTLILVLAL